MALVVYWLISGDKKKTYVGFSDNIERRIAEHKSKQVRTTRNFGNFKYFILEKVDDECYARKREKYWKSCAGRKKLKIIFEKVK